MDVLLHACIEVLALTRILEQVRMQELLHIVLVGIVGKILDASEEVDAEIVVTAILQMRAADVGRARVHGG